MKTFIFMVGFLIGLVVGSWAMYTDCHNHSATHFHGHSVEAIEEYKEIK